MLVEIHMLQNHAPCNLNRDNVGSPKTCVFGNVPRSRISSQCIKRSIRISPVFAEEMRGAPLGYRTRHLPECVKKKLMENGIDERTAESAARLVTKLGQSAKSESNGNKKQTKQKSEGDNLITSQMLFITQNDIDAIAAALLDLIRSGTLGKKSPDSIEKEVEDRGMRRITPDIALFGRMSTSAAIRSVESSIQVAHAISTNKMEHEFDYFTAVDDLQKVSEDEGPGAGMVGDAEFNSACYYKYFSLDFDALVANLTGPNPDKKTLDDARELARRTVIAFLKAAILTTPRGKQNSFAAHQPPSAILIEVRPVKTPISYANAFVNPSRPHDGIDLIKDSIQKFVSYSQNITRRFNLQSNKRLWFSTVDEIRMENAETCETIDSMISSLMKCL